MTREQQDHGARAIGAPIAHALQQLEPVGPRRLQIQDYGMDALKNACVWIAERSVRHPRLVVSLGLVTVIVLGAIYVTLPPRYRLADQVPDREQAIAASSELDQKLIDLKRMYDSSSSSNGIWRSQAEIRELFGDFELIDPGMTWITEWHPEETGPNAPVIEFASPNESVGFCGVGRKRS